VIRRAAAAAVALSLTVVLAAGCAARPDPALPGEPALPGNSGTPPVAERPASRRDTRALRRLRADLTEVFGAPIMARGVWGVVVRSLDSGESIFELNAGKLMMPASNMKIVTLATAAEILGWDHRFTTTLETAAPIVDGVLRGDLFVRGTGDPTINSREGRAPSVLFDWTTALRAAGIREIDGRIIGDDQAFDDDGLGAGWAWDYLQYGYAAPSGALQFNEDIAQLRVSPGARVGDPAILELPSGAGFTLVNRVITGSEASSVTIDYRRHLYQPELEVTGSIPVKADSAIRSVAVVNPTRYFAQSLKEALIGTGINVHGEAVDNDDVAGALAGASVARRVLASTDSPTLREMGTVLMKVSQNLYAETFVKAMGAAGGEVGTTSGGRSAMLRTLTSWGIPEDAYVVADGSGLSRYNYVSAEMITAVLERMYRDPRHRDAFLKTLPIAGKDGTVASRMRGSLAEGNAVAKTGSIANVRSLSGYVRTRDGEMLVFAILANDFAIPAATVTWIADLAVETLAAYPAGGQSR
jgi:D-alanyl-D-alanine carboxypeptidase/D-alanyl-D-alanine-endopeptidase (penicillin-binding protein 4)